MGNRDAHEKNLECLHLFVDIIFKLVFHIEQ